MPAWCSRFRPACRREDARSVLPPEFRLETTASSTELASAVASVTVIQQKPVARIKGAFTLREVSQ